MIKIYFRLRYKKIYKKKYKLVIMKTLSNFLYSSLVKYEYTYLAFGYNIIYLYILTDDTYKIW